MKHVIMKDVHGLTIFIKVPN